MSVYVIYPTDEQDESLIAFLEASDIEYVKDDEQELPSHVLEGIARGQADFKADRFITLEEFNKRFPDK